MTKEEFEIQKANKRKRDEEHFQWLQENQIRFEDCKPGYTYEVDARNFGTAIFFNDVFYGIRTKWRDVFIAYEIHWDKDETHGTVRPQKEIEKTPDEIIDALKYYIDTKVGGQDTKKAFEIVKEYLQKFIK